MRRRGAALSAALMLLAGCVSSEPAPTPGSTTQARIPQPVPGPPRIVAAEFLFDRPARQGGVVFGTVPAPTLALTVEGRPALFAADGRFFAAFGRDHGPSAVIEARQPDGAILRQVVAVAPRHWDIQSIPSLRRGTTPTPVFLARRKVELDQIRAARMVRSVADGWLQAFRWPVTGRVSGIFGSQRIYAGERGDYHAGVDVARPTGTPVTAPADGVVVLAAASPFTLEGNLLIVDHGNGLTSAFLHLSRIDVTVGQRLRQGEALGAIGMTGRATGPHLHWAMTWQGERIDPVELAGPMR